jgi:hypothetical protein
MEGQYPEWWKKKGNPTSGSSNTQTPKPTANVTTVDTTVGSSNSDGEYYALVTEVNSVPNTTQPHAQVVTFADSACSDHCFVNRSDFTSYRPVKDKDGDTATKGGKFSIHGTGRVEKRTIFDGRVVSLVFENAIHAPDLNHNLISIGKLDKAGCYTVFGGGGMICLSRDGKPFINGSAAGTEGTMYEVEIYPPTGPLTQKNPRQLSLSVEDARKAHSRVLAFAT